MAIALDSSSKNGTTWGSGTSLSWSHTCSGTDRVLLVMSYVYNGTAASATSITYNGVALTKADGVASTLESNNQYVELWYLVAPATGANTITINYSASVSNSSGDAISFTGVDQSNPIDSHAASATASTVTSYSQATTVVASNCWLAGTIATRNGPATAGAGTTLRQSNSGTYQVNGDSNTTVSTGSQALNWNFSSSAVAGAVTVSIQPPQAAPATSSGPSLLSLLGVGN